MATTTTNYGWDIPQSTDLVKDGATAIATLGQDIDTSVYTALAGKKSGLVLLNTTTFSGVTAVSLAANSFTSTYRNYKLLVTGTSTATAINELAFRFRASGSDNTTSNYYYYFYRRTSAAASNEYANTTSFKMGLYAPHFCVNFDIFQPQTATNSMVIASSTGLGTDSGGEWDIGHFNATTSFDAATFYVGVGNISGEYSLYGYNL